mmetsp:Transcript_14221/g.25268  ORF Transcript_14221/g.25268 Transcript_14221/m.25268 type:complete len:759 (+) Transcript_14221:1580-3856(+)
MKFATFAVVFTSVVGNAASQISEDAYPRIEGLVIKDESLKEHHTDFFKIDSGFAVRRGQKFTLVVETSSKLDISDMTINFEVNESQEKREANNYPQFNATISKALSDRSYEVEVVTSANSAIGKYEDIVLYVQDSSTSNNSSLVDAEGFLYEYPFPVYFLFNPFLAEDKDVYVDNTTMLEEYVLNEYGMVYSGSLNSYQGVKWHYGQSNQITLDAAFHLLKNLDRSKMANVIDVVQTMSHHQGMMRNKSNPDGPAMVGDYNALLEGNWGDFPFENDTHPGVWTSTTDILNKWKETGKPVHYGQCWVFGALQNALMRSIGVAARHLSAFGAAVDGSSKEDKYKRNHHVVDEYFDKNGTSVWSLGRLWNFHSWNDIYLNRENASYSGWQSLDGTPPGLGPAPLKAVLALDEAAPFNTSFVISTVHATVRNFFVTCDKNHTKKDKLNGCTVEKMLKYDPTGLKLIVSSQTLPNGTLAMDNITSQFVNSSLDAFIPFEHDNALERLAAGQKLAAPLLEVYPSAHGILLGQPIEGEIVVNTKTLRAGQKIQINFRVNLETVEGELIKEIAASNGELTVGHDSNVTLPYNIAPESYLVPNLFNAYVKIVATGYAEDGEHFMDTAVMDVDAPEIKLSAGNLYAGSKHAAPVDASFENPLNQTLENVCLTIHSHELDFAGVDKEITSATKCVTLAPFDKVTLHADLVAPKTQGTYHVASTVSGKFIPYTQTDVEINVTKKRGIFEKVVEETKTGLRSILDDISSLE